MDSKTVFSKTAKGLREASGASSALPRALRAILKEIDGKKTFADLQVVLRKYSEAELRQTLEGLEKDGYLRDVALMAQTATTVSSPSVQTPSASKPQADGEGDDLDFMSLAQPSASPPPRPAADQEAAGARAKQEAEEKVRREAAEKAKREAEEKARLAAQAKARQEAEEKLKREAEATVRREAAEKLKREAEEKARREAEERIRREAEEKAKREAEAAAKKAAEEAARKEAEQQVRREAEEKARKEAEARARQEAEEKARRETEERLRREAEEKVRQEAEAAARKAAEESARKEAEERARREAEEKVRREAEEKMRRESEERARIEAEERARREEEERQKREAEEKVRREEEKHLRKVAEEQARIEAEVRARQEAEERAAREAEEKIRREAEEKVRRETDEAMRREAEAQTRRELAERAKREAEEKERLIAWEAAKRKAEEKLKREAEEKARREAEDRIRVETKERAQREEEERQKEALKEKARLEAEEQAELDRQARIRKEAEEELREEVKEKAKREARALAEREAAEKAALASERKASRGGVNWVKVFALYLAPFVAVVLVAVHFVPFNYRIPALEAAASGQFGQPVKIESLHFSLFPQPHWRFDGVTVGGAGEIKAQRVNAVIDLTSLAGYKSLDLVSPTIRDDAAAMLLFGHPQGAAVKFSRLTASKASFESNAIDLPDFDFKADIGADGNWRKIVLEFSNRDVYVELHPGADRIPFELNAVTLAPPFGGSLRLDDLTAKGDFGPKDMRIAEFEGRNAGGSINGTANIRWSGAWNVNGTLNARQIDAKKIAPALFAGSHVDGKAAFFSMQAKDAKTLFAAAHAEGTFMAGQGDLLGIDLMHLMQGAADSGKTGFRQLSGTFVLDGDLLQLRQIRFDAGILSAGGNAEWRTNDTVRGSFTTSYRFDNIQKNGAMVLSGTLQAPKFGR